MNLTEYRSGATRYATEAEANAAKKRAERVFIDLISVTALKASEWIVCANYRGRTRFLVEIA